MYMKPRLIIAFLGAGLLPLAAGAQDPRTGPRKENYPNGKIKAQYTLDAEGKRHRRTLEYYENGKRKLSANYDHGVLDGAYQEYYENGKTRVKKRYKKGKLDGDLLRMTDRGLPLYRVTVKRGKVFHYPDFRAPVPVYERTVEEIRKKLDEIDPPGVFKRWPVAERFEVPNVLKAPYKAGTLKKEYMESAVRHLNAYRYLAGLDHEVTVDAGYCGFSQHGSVVNAVNNQMSHTPRRPKDMDEEFFKKGYKGCSSSNLSMRPRGELRDCIDGYMNDSDSRNIQEVGHRKWCLSPRMGKVGFGEAGPRGAYKSLYVFDRSNGKAKAPELLAYPSAGYFPLEYYAQGAAWSVAPSGGKLTLPPQGEMNLEVWQLNDEYDLERKLEINHTSIPRWSMGKALVFRPVLPPRQKLDGMKFLVSVSGKRPPRISYIVHFFRRKP